MGNNARLGFTLQKLICDKYHIIPESEFAINQFNASYDSSEKEKIEKTIKGIFDALKLNPIKCTTLLKDECGKDVPYNFILNDNSTLSVRTNMNGDKIAPRRVGQAGFPKLNEYFGRIYGKEIETQDDIKRLMLNHIEEVMPIFTEHLFDADYVVWIYNDEENDEYKFHILNGNSYIGIEYKKELFSFTKDSMTSWNESNTIKYNSKSIAEVQVHKERTFKFRFIMNNVIPLIINNEINNETLGMTVEKTICDLFKLEHPSNFYTRYSADMELKLKPILRKAFKQLPKPIQSTGSTKGARGGNSKCSYDFILDGNKTLSVKSNMGKMVCPPEVGQPGASTCYLYFKDLIDGEEINKLVFKEMVLTKIDKMLPIYLEHMFDSDFLLWIYKKADSFEYKILDINYAKNMQWDYSKISFTKMTIEEWNESNTLKYDGVSIGEFQVHNNRDCFKFRFNFKNLMKVIEGESSND